jgi:hypothetical protein
MQIIPRTLYASPIKFTANQTVTIDGPRNARIQRIECRLTGTVDTSSAARADDGVLNLIKALKVRRNGNDVKFSVAAKHLRLINVGDYGTAPELVDVPASGTATGSAFSATLVIDFRAQTKNPFDVTGALNGKDATALTIEVDWADATVLGTGYSNLTNVQVLVTVFEAYMSRAEEDSFYGALNPRTGLRERDLCLVRTFTTKTVDAQYNTYQFPIDLPMGNIVRRSHIYVRRAAARDDTQVTAYRLQQNAPNPLTLMDFDWSASQSLDRLDYLIPTAIDGNFVAKGYTVVDYTDQGHLDARGLKKGDVQLQFTTIAPSGTTDITLVNEEWVPAAN